MKKQEGKVVQFIKRNAVYFILALCIVAVGVSMLIYFLTTDTQTLPDNPSIENPNPDDGNQGENNGNEGNEGGETNNPDNNPDVPVDTPTDPDKPVTTVITFAVPVENVTQIEKYSELPVFSDTLGRYTAHLAIDFFAPEGTNVTAVYDGSVESVETTLLHGTTIVIDHGNGLKTVYNSLLDGETVNVGQQVKKGDVIGQVSVTNRQESKSGAHLHFQVQENGEIINPDKYLSLDEK